MNEQVIISVAQAIVANAECLKALIETLSADTKAAVEAKVGKKAAKDTPAPAPVATPIAAAPMPAAPFPTPVTTVPIDQAPVTIPVFTQPQATPAPIPTASVAVQPAPVAPTPVTASPSSVPFNDTPTLMSYMMSAYQGMGPQKGARIQECLTQVGLKAVNEVQPQHYAQLYQLVEALKVSA